MKVQTLAGIVSVGTLLLGFGEVVMSQPSQPGYVSQPQAVASLIEKAAKGVPTTATR